MPRSSFSVAGFASALGSLFAPCFGLTGVCALALSAIGRARDRQSHASSGLAAAGIVISIVSLCLNCAEIALYMIFLR